MTAIQPSETVMISLSDLLCDELDGPNSLESLMDSLLVTCVEGGSNYWCGNILLAEGQTQPKPEDHDEDEGYPWYCVAFRAGTAMRVSETDFGRIGKKTWHQLDRARGITALKRMAEADGTPKRHFQSLMNEGGGVDAECADVWLQLAVLGEVRYG